MTSPGESAVSSFAKAASSISSTTPGMSSAPGMDAFRRPATTKSMLGSARNARTMRAPKFPAPPITTTRIWGLGVRAGLQGVPGLPPGFHSTVQSHRALESHLAQGRGCQRRDTAEFATDKNSHRRIGQLVIDPQLQLPTWQQPRAGDVARFKRFALAHIEHDQFILTGFQAGPELRQ